VTSLYPIQVFPLERPPSLWPEELSRVAPKITSTWAAQQACMRMQSAICETDPLTWPLGEHLANMILVLRRRSGWFKRHTTHHVQRCQIKRSSAFTNAAETSTSPILPRSLMRGWERNCAGLTSSCSTMRWQRVPHLPSARHCTGNQRAARGAKHGHHERSQGNGKPEFIFRFTIEFHMPNPRTVQLLPYPVGTVHARAATR
jgi:hypothetical protein